jgi:Ni/Fe-hydrogenase subunit HybB-like protein
MRSRLPLTWVAVLVSLCALVGLGVHGVWQQIEQGDGVTGMRTIGAGGAAWGLYIAMDGFFLSLGVAAMAGACMARFSRDRSLEAVARIAMPVSIACSLAAGLSVLADQGRPWQALRALFLYARPESPLFVTFTCVGSVCLYGSLVHCVLARRPDLAEYAKRPSSWQGLQRFFAAGYAGTPAQRHRRRRAGLWMSVLMLPALLAPLTALAIAFTVRVSRPLSVTIVEVATFLTTAAAGGMALILGSAALIHRWSGPDAGLDDRGTARLGRGLLVALSLSLVGLVAAPTIGLLSGELAVVRSARALVGSPYAILFWSQWIVMFVAALLLGLAARRPVRDARWMGLASALTLVGILLHRYLLLVVWQTHGHALPYPPGAYAPTWTEGEVAAGIVALCFLLLLPAIRLIPFAPCVLDRGPLVGDFRDRTRTALTGLWLVIGLALASVGWLSSNRLGTDAFLDPRIEASPAIFIAGLVWLASAGAFYELLPERRAKPRASASASAPAASQPVG